MTSLQRDHWRKATGLQGAWILWCFVLFCALRTHSIMAPRSHVRFWNQAVTAEYWWAWLSIQGLNCEYKSSNCGNNTQSFSSVGLVRIDNHTPFLPFGSPTWILKASFIIPIPTIHHRTPMRRDPWSHYTSPLDHLAFQPIFLSVTLKKNTEHWGWTVAPLFWSCL